MDPASIIAGILRAPHGREAAADIAGMIARPAKGFAAMHGLADPSVAPWLQRSIIPEKYNYPYGTPQKTIDDDKMHALGEQFLGFGGVMKAVGPKIAQALRATPEPSGIRAYHGSPHDFDKFSMSKIGTGEGAQAYGHGLYFAENPSVAQSYRELAGRGASPADLAASVVNAYRGDRAAAIAELDRRLASASPQLKPEFAPRVAEAKKAIETGAFPGRMYEVNIRANPNEFLDWDKPLGDAAQKLSGSGLIQSRVSPRNVASSAGYGPEISAENLLGSDAYRLLSRQSAMEYPGATKGAPPPPGFNADARAAAILRDAGIPGIRYLDQGSRPVAHLDARIARIESMNPKEGPLLEELNRLKAQRADAGATSNYVLFRDDIIDILRKYGIPPVGIAGVGALGAAAMPDQAQAADLTPTGIARALRETK